MERKRSGAQNRPNYEYARGEVVKQSYTSTPTPSVTSTDSQNAFGAGQSALSEQERLRLVVGAARQKTEVTPQEAEDSVLTYRRRRRRQKRVTPRFFAFVACTMLICLVFSYAVAFWRIREVEQRILTLKSQIDAVTARNEQLKSELERVTSDAYIEEVAREELGLVMPGETAWVIMTPGNPNSPFQVEERGTSRLNATEGW